MTALQSLQVSHITSQHHDPLSHCHHGRVLLLGHVISFAPQCTTVKDPGRQDLLGVWCYYKEMSKYLSKSCL